MEVNQNLNVASFFGTGNQTNISGNSKNISKDTKDFASFLEGANDKTKDDSTEVPISEKKPVKAEQDVVSEKKEAVDAEVEKVISEKDTIEENVQKMDLEETETPVEMEEVVDMIVDETQMVIPEFDIVVSANDMKDISNEDIIAVVEVLGDLLQHVMQYFEMSFQELTQKIEEFGMEFADLLSKDGMKEFFLQMNQADVSNLLVDENLNTQLDIFMSGMEEQFQALEFLMPEDGHVVLPEKVEMILSELQFVQEDDDEIVLETTVHKDAVMVDEPQVVVMNQKEDSSSMNNPQHDQAQTSAKEITVPKEQVETKDVSVMKQNSFENPILQAIQNAVNDVENVVISDQPNQQVDVVRQIVEQVRVNMNQQTTSLELQLYPEHLGRIQIHVVSKEGIMTASIVAETEAAKQAIESGLLNLKEAMEQQDLKVDAIEVMVSTMGFEKGDEQQNSYKEGETSNSRRRMNLSELNDEISIDDEAEIEKMKVTGSSVSYMA